MSDTKTSAAAGGCLCGAVRYTLDRSAVLGAAHCHCRDCQRCTGSGFATFVFAPDAAFDVPAQGLSSFAVKGESGGTVERFFCGTCGSQLFSRVAVMPGVNFVKAGSLDDAGWVEPGASYWGASAWPWAPPCAGLTVHEHNPG
ncbi:MAG: GFA family protein [Myxococcota bacterium]